MFGSSLTRSTRRNQFFDFNPWIVSICLYITFWYGRQKANDPAYTQKAPNMGAI